MNEITRGAEPDAKAGLFSQLANLFVAPSQALDYARGNPGKWWLPLGVLLVFQAAFLVWWALTVNLNAYHLAEVQMLTRMHPENAGQFSHFIMQQGRGTLLLSAGLGGVIGVAIAELLYALYLFVADKVFSADSKGYGHWLSFTAWISLPVTLGVIANMVTLAISSRMSVNPTDVTSLNTLFLHLKPWDPHFKIAQFSILQFWVIGLGVLGLKRWCNHGTAKALGIVLAPYIVLYLILYLV